MQIWESVRKNVKIIGFLDIFWDILNKMKGNLDQECVKGGLLSFQGKIGPIAPDFHGKWQLFQFWPYFSACPSLNSGFPTRSKIIFLKLAIIGLFAKKFHNVIFKIVDLVAIWKLIFSAEIAIFSIKHLSFKELLW